MQRRQQKQTTKQKQQQQQQQQQQQTKLFMLDMTCCLQIGSERVLNLELVLHAFALFFLLHGQLKKEAAAASAAEHQAAAADAHPLTARRGELNLRRGCR